MQWCALDIRAPVWRDGWRQALFGADRKAVVLIGNLQHARLGNEIAHAFGQPGISSAR
jgi:hypothetical protein